MGDWDVDFLGALNGRDYKGETAACRRFSQIFADLVLDVQGKWFGAAENCGKPRETAGNRRKPQKIAGGSFDPFLPFSLSH